MKRLQTIAAFVLLVTALLLLPAPQWASAQLNRVSVNQIVGTLAATKGGTGQASYTIGDLLYASSTTALSKLADVAVNQVLVSGGIGAPPAYSASPRVTAIGLGAAAGASGATFANATLINDSALGTLAMVSSAATNGFRIPNGSNGEYCFGCQWASNIAEYGTVPNGGSNRSVRIKANTTGAIIFQSDGSDDWNFNTSGNLIDLGAHTIVAGAQITATNGFKSAGSGLAVANVGANSCGTSAATIAGNNSSFEITVGATAGTQCRVTFTAAATTRWNCTVTDSTTTIATRATFVDTTHTDFLGAFVAGDVVTAICVAR